jgi:hypothetical protein
MPISRVRSGHRHQHDVHDPDTGDEQRDAGDGPGQRLEQHGDGPDARSSEVRVYTEKSAGSVGPSRCARRRVSAHLVRGGLDGLLGGGEDADLGVPGLRAHQQVLHRGLGHPARGDPGKRVLRGAEDLERRALQEHLVACDHAEAPQRGLAEHHDAGSVDDVGVGQEPPVEERDTPHLGEVSEVPMISRSAKPPCSVVNCP